MRQVTHALLTRPPLSHKWNHSEKFCPWCFVRLACVKHAASVHPEPGSNSRLKFLIHFRMTLAILPSITVVWNSSFLMTFTENLLFIFRDGCCSIINVLDSLLLSAATRLYYHDCFALSTTFFIFLIFLLLIKTRNKLNLSSLLLPQQSAWIEYYFYIQMSTLFFIFFNFFFIFFNFHFNFHI